jgi:tRNA-intron endonuclease, archaea type
MSTKKIKLNKKQEEKTTKIKVPIKAVFSKEVIITENSDPARDLYNQSRYGIILKDGRVQLSLVEAVYLAEKKTIELVSSAGRKLKLESFFKKAVKLEHNFFTRYYVFKDMRNRGYIIKTALKFGADFRVYNRGVKPGEDHAKWIVYPVKETSSLTWYEFSAKNRVAHSTKKKLLVGVVDAENDVTYWEIKWTRP